MPRRSEFDPSVALENAMKQFWLQGYCDTSLDDLVSATGVSRYGLYGTFGGKRELFLKTLDSYRDDLVTRQLGALEGKNAGWSEIEAYFGFLISLAQTPEGQAGCFMCNTAVELAPHDAEVAVKVEAHLQRFQEAFRRALKNAQSVDDVPKHVDVDEYADVLVGVTQGIFALSRLPENLPIIQNLVKGALKMPH